MSCCVTKPTKSHWHPMKTQIRLGILLVCTMVAYKLSFLHADSKDRCPSCSVASLDMQVISFVFFTQRLKYLLLILGVAVEFGTVLIFTCKQSCWEEGAAFRTEHVIVQADPDQDLFS